MFSGGISASFTTYTSCSDLANQALRTGISGFQIDRGHLGENA